MMATNPLYAKVDDLETTLGADEALRVLSYEVRRAVVQARFQRAPYGTQTAAATDTGLSASTVSAVLSGLYRREDVLRLLEKWADLHLP